jgi:Flp pilus assembly protein TadB
MGLRERAARLDRRVSKILARQAGDLKKDVNRIRRAITPHRISHSLLIIGAGVIVVSISNWLPVLAGVLAGVFAIVYGLIFVDLDGGEQPSVRWRARK